MRAYLHKDKIIFTSLQSAGQPPELVRILYVNNMASSSISDLSLAFILLAVGIWLLARRPTGPKTSVVCEERDERRGGGTATCLPPHAHALNMQATRMDPGRVYLSRVRGVAQLRHTFLKAHSLPSVPVGARRRKAFPHLNTVHQLGTLCH